MRFPIAIFLFVSLCAPAQAQLVIQGGKPVSDAAANSTAIAPINEPDDGTGPVEAVVGGTNFPASAITEVGTPTASGRTSDSPANVAQRKIIAADDPRWPTDTLDIFVSACASTRHQLVGPCRCVIEKMALTMPHNEFIELSDMGRVEQDPRFIAARSACIPATEAPAER